MLPAATVPEYEYALETLFWSNVVRSCMVVLVQDTLLDSYRPPEAPVRASGW